MITVTRFHDFSAGHRVTGHEGACAHLHGHNYRVHFTIGVGEREKQQLDSLGRVLDFGVVKNLLCEWLESHWDHRMLVFYRDTWVDKLHAIDPEGVCVVPFNPTAENMAGFLLNIVGPQIFGDSLVQLIEVTVEETRKCRATASKNYTSVTAKEDV
jgi:6-pyruvoyltetrahydropterin/6-carboxytetrahydropterin synthase